VRYLRRIPILAAAFGLVAFAVANPQPVTLRIWPDMSLPAPRVTAPVFAVLLATLFVGYALGCLTEWVRRTKRASKRHERSS